MTRWRWWSGAALSLVVIAIGCGSDGDSNVPGDVDGGKDGSAGLGGAAGDASVDGKPDTSVGGNAGAGGGTAGKAGAGGGNVGGAGSAGASGDSGAAGAGGDSGAAGAAGSMAGAAGSGPCVPVNCQNHVYQCGDCLDNDNDGKIDMQDPDCLGPCHNNETKFDLSIPGGGNAPCKLDCYYDQDTGAGNDDCYWNHECDPYEIAPNWYPEGDTCKFNANANTPGTNKSCSELLAAQSQTCLDTCKPLTPNGCDCFGCCELPAESGNYVWLGSYGLLADGGTETTCSLGVMSDPTKCHPCTPVPGCLNPCEHCKLCLGKTELPPDCFPQPDAGTGGAGGQPGTGGTGGTPGDAGVGGAGGTPGLGGSAGSVGTGGTGGTPGCGGQICPTTSQPCGLWCQPPCPGGYFCLTGCCQKSPS
ncbi:MAG: hypothetical protein HY898_05600 [Deltaproteobacteria bacterium]|nr:hypothetical protein [Deltaproteobacteria bacterium]